MIIAFPLEGAACRTETSKAACVVFWQVFGVVLHALGATVDENTSRKIGAFLPEVDRVPGNKKKRKNVGQPLVNTVRIDFWAGLHSSVEVRINVELFFFSI